MVWFAISGGANVLASWLTRRASAPSRLVSSLAPPNCTGTKSPDLSFAVLDRVPRDFVSCQLTYMKKIFEAFEDFVSVTPDHL